LKDEITKSDFVQVPAGCFSMGVSQTGDMTHDGILMPPRRDETPRHEVCLKSFQIARTETTVGQWNRFMPERRLSMPDALPANGIALESVEEYIRRLNDKGTAAGHVYRLPTEAEWEYACRAGKQQPAEGDPSFQNREMLRKEAHFLDDVRRNSDSLPVGTLKANAFGLFDMLGNVWEWTADTYSASAYARHSRDNPLHRDAGVRRVIRGGSWRTGEFETRCGARAWGIAGDPLETIGFRLVREPMRK
jgi:formylglycine-generating enzyme required for sulfatase activity